MTLDKTHLDGLRQRCQHTIDWVGTIHCPRTAHNEADSKAVLELIRHYETTAQQFNYELTEDDVFYIRDKADTHTGFTADVGAFVESLRARLLRVVRSG